MYYRNMISKYKKMLKNVISRHVDVVVKCDTFE